MPASGHFDHKDGEIHHIGPRGAGDEKITAAREGRIAVIVPQKGTRGLPAAHAGHAAGVGETAGRSGRAVRTVRAREEAADGRQILKLQRGRKRHFLIAAAQTVARDRHRGFAARQQADAPAARMGNSGHAPGFGHERAPPPALRR